MKTNRTIITLVVLLAGVTAGTLSNAAENTVEKSIETSIDENTREAVDELHDSDAWERIAGNWEALESDVKARWDKLSGDDLAELDGEREVLVGKVQDAYGMTRAEAEADVDDWASYQ